MATLVNTRTGLQLQFGSRPTGVLVPLRGRDGTSISIAGQVPTYGDLPSGLGAADAGSLYIVQGDGLGYVWSGTAWPADGEGIEIQGPQGETGRGYTSVAVDDDDLVFTSSDGTEDRATVPALTAAAAAAATAEGHATAAATQAGVATTQAGLAAGHAENAQDAADAAAQSAQDAAAVVTDGVPNATSTVKGGIMLRGDLGGSYDNPTVPGLASKVNATQAESIAQGVLDAWVGAAPEQLDTLTELAAALDNDPNFASTMTATLAGKAASVHTHGISDVSGLQSALDGKASGSHTHTAEQISDATTVGRNLMKAASAQAARDAIGAGTSSLALGDTSTTAMPGDRIQLVSSLPSSPDTGVLYLIPE